MRVSSPTEARGWHAYAAARLGLAGFDAAVFEAVRRRLGLSTATLARLLGLVPVSGVGGPVDGDALEGWADGGAGGGGGGRGRPESGRDPRRSSGAFACLPFIMGHSGLKLDPAHLVAVDQEPVLPGVAHLVARRTFLAFGANEPGRTAQIDEALPWIVRPVARVALEAAPVDELEHHEPIPLFGEDVLPGGVSRAA